MAAAVCMLLTVSSCVTITENVQYQFATQEDYGYYDQAKHNAFANDIQEVINSLSGTEANDSKVIAAFDAVVAKYDNDAIWGTCKLSKFVDGESKGVIKTWVMKAANN